MQGQGAGEAGGIESDVRGVSRMMRNGKGVQRKEWVKRNEGTSQRMHAHL